MAGTGRWAMSRHYRQETGGVGNQCTHTKTVLRLRSKITYERIYNCATMSSKLTPLGSADHCAFLGVSVCMMAAQKIGSSFKQYHNNDLVIFQMWS